MKDLMRENIGEQVDAISKKLLDEFLQHADECQRANSEMTDRHTIFEAWAIQKVAGLQGLVLKLSQHVYELERNKKL